MTILERIITVYLAGRLQATDIPLSVRTPLLQAHKAANAMTRQQRYALRLAAMTPERRAETPTFEAATAKVQVAKARNATWRSLKTTALAIPEAQRTEAQRLHAALADTAMDDTKAEALHYGD